MIDWRAPPRAANDNHWPSPRTIWPWAVAITLAPLVSAAAILVMSF